MKNKYVIFARTATKEQTLNDYSLNGQISLLQELAEKRNLFISEIIKEYGVSGTSKNRPEFNRMMDLLKNGSIKGVLCTELSRLSRSPEVFLTLQILMRQKLISIITLEGTYNSADERNLLVFSIMSGVNAFYRQEHSAAIKRGLQAKKLKG